MSVVVLDYPGLGAAKRTRRLRLEQHGLPVRYLLEEVRPRTVVPDRYVQALLARLGDTAIDVVIAYCASASLARRLTSARRICLINPEFPDGGFAVDALSELLPHSQIEPLSDDRLAVLQDELTQSHLRNFDRDDLVSNTLKAATGLAGSQIEWISHLAAAGEPADVVAHELHFTSADHPCDDDCSAEHVVFGSDARTMFRDPALAEKIISEVAVHA